MDPTSEIKARLPIEQLVAQYCELQKKGKSFRALCPFHNDKNPSFLVSPDKGIAYCFACQSGGDIFSFYQKIEGVDFPQALRDLAEKAGVTLPEHREHVKKDEKERMRECLAAAQMFYCDTLRSKEEAGKYLATRGLTESEWKELSLGFAPEDQSGLYEELLRKGFSRSEILASGMAFQRELRDERMIDRFRNRIMFPIKDTLGRLVGFAGRTLGQDDAKYLNSPESVLYRKSALLYGYAEAKERMRELKTAILVEGYFDVLACRRIGIQNVLACCGTALTEEHARLLKRTVETVVLCFDQDEAGRSAAERAFMMLSVHELVVEIVLLSGKDPADVVIVEPEALHECLEKKRRVYLDHALDEVKEIDRHDPLLRRAGLQRVVQLIRSIPSAVERQHYLKAAALALETTESALEQDLHIGQKPKAFIKEDKGKTDEFLFSRTEIALGLFLLYPSLRNMLSELIPPEEKFATELYRVLCEGTEGEKWDIDRVSLSDAHRERAKILQLYCEQHGFAEWSVNLAPREVRKNCTQANRDILHKRQREIVQKLLDARKEGHGDEASLLEIQYQEVLKIAKMAG